MSLFRWTFGLPLAAAVTAFLFLLMSGLIGQETRLDDARAAPALSILAKLKPTEPKTSRPARPQPLNAPPAPMTRSVERVDRVGPVFTHPAPAKVDGGVPSLTGVTPIIRLSPVYPDACRARGAEGVVLVQFDVGAAGEVLNPRVISSDSRCFDRTVIKTVLGWKYPPQARRGVTERFVFTLTE